MKEVVMHTVELYSTRETTERVAKILDSNYAKYDLDNVAAAAVQLDKICAKNIKSSNII